MRTLKVFSPSEIEQFIEEGYVYLRGGFTRAQAEPVLQQVWDLIPDTKRDDPSTWKKPLDAPKGGPKGPDVAALYTPRVRAAFDDLLGEGYWAERGERTGAWPFAFPGFDKPPSVEPAEGWHIDGGGTHPRPLNSPVQALIAIMMFSDVGPGDGGTAVRPGSHKIAARIIRDGPVEGYPYGGPDGLLSRVLAHPTWPPAVESNGQIGDLIICHGLIVHSRYPNTSKDKVRIITNNCISLRENAVLDRADPQDYTPYETSMVRVRDEVVAQR